MSNVSRDGLDEIIHRERNRLNQRLTVEVKCRFITHKDKQSILAEYDKWAKTAHYKDTFYFAGESFNLTH